MLSAGQVALGVTPPFSDERASLVLLVTYNFRVGVSSSSILLEFGLPWTEERPWEYILLSKYFVSPKNIGSSGLWLIVEAVVVPEGVYCKEALGDGSSI
jgi:hypothetical protein